MQLRDEGTNKVSPLYLTACTCNSILYKRLPFLWGHARRNPYYSYLIKTFTERKEESGGRGGGLHGGAPWVRTFGYLCIQEILRPPSSR